MDHGSTPAESLSHQENPFVAVALEVSREQLQKALAHLEDLKSRRN